MNIDVAQLRTEIDKAVHRVLSDREDPWLRRREAAARENLSLCTFNRRDRAGKGPRGHGVGRYRRWRQSVIDAFIESQK